MPIPHYPKAVAVTLKPVDDCILVHDAVHQKIHVLNETAAEILTLCTGSYTLEEITDAIANDADVSREQIRKDIDEIVTQFQELGLLEEVMISP